MYKKYPITMRKEDESKAKEVLTTLRNEGDVDSWNFSRWDENLIDCYVTPIVSEDLDYIKSELTKAGIQLI